MKTSFTIILILLISGASVAQKRIYIYVQDPSLEGYSQYTTAMYGLVTFLDKDESWTSTGHDTYYSKSLNSNIHIRKEENFGWMSNTLDFIMACEKSSNSFNNDSVLYVYVGHNALLDTTVDLQFTDCYDNMLFGCFTENWEGIVDNTLLNTTGFMAPEAYCILPAIIAWSERKHEKEIRRTAAAGYASYQKNTNLPTAQKLFGL